MFRKSPQKFGSYLEYDEKRFRTPFQIHGQCLQFFLKMFIGTGQSLLQGVINV